MNLALKPHKDNPMKFLDQAFIRAYTPNAGVSEVPAPAGNGVPQSHSVPDDGVTDLSQDGARYRWEPSPRRWAEALSPHTAFPATESDQNPSPLPEGPISGRAEVRIPKVSDFLAKSAGSNVSASAPYSQTDLGGITSQVGSQASWKTWSAVAPARIDRGISQSKIPEAPIVGHSSELDVAEPDTAWEPAPALKPIQPTAGRITPIRAHASASSSDIREDLFRELDQSTIEREMAAPQMASPQAAAPQAAPISSKPEPVTKAERLPRRPSLSDYAPIMAAPVVEYRLEPENLFQQAILSPPGVVYDSTNELSPRSAVISNLPTEVPSAAAPAPSLSPDHVSPSNDDPAHENAYRLDGAHAAIPKPHVGAGTHGGKGASWKQTTTEPNEGLPGSQVSKHAGTITASEMEAAIRRIEDAHAALDANANEATAVPESKSDSSRVDVAKSTVKDDEATEETETPVVKKGEEPLVAMWEVDDFLWPENVRRLRERCSYFDKVGAKLKSAISDGLRVLGITSAKRGVGRSTLAMALAKSAANSGLKTALLDADFARPTLANDLGIEVQGGWDQAILGQLTLGESAVKSVDESLTFFPLAQAIDLQFQDPKVKNAIRQIATTFELVIVDLGPVDQVLELDAKTHPLPLHVALVVFDSNQEDPEIVRESARKLVYAGVEAVGLAENFSE